MLLRKNTWIPTVNSHFWEARTRLQTQLGVGGTQPMFSHAGSFKLKRISVTRLPFILSPAVHLSVHYIHFKNGPPSHALFPPPAALPRGARYWIFHLRRGLSQILALLFLILCFSRNGHQLPQPVSADFILYIFFFLPSVPVCRSHCTSPMNEATPSDRRCVKMWLPEIKVNFGRGTRRGSLGKSARIWIQMNALNQEMTSAFPRLPPPKWKMPVSFPEMAPRKGILQLGKAHVKQLQWPRAAGCSSKQDAVSVLIYLTHAFYYFFFTFCADTWFSICSRLLATNWASAVKYKHACHWLG